MKNKNKKKLIIIIIFLIILFVCGFLFIKYGLNKKYTIILDTSGGSKISSIEVKDGEIIKLPDAPTKEGYTFSCWVNENNEVINTGDLINKNTTLKAVWVNNEVESSTILFDTDGGNNINSIIIEEGNMLLLPINPIKKGYIFAGWINDSGNIVNNELIINDNTTLKALWIKEKAEIKTIKIDTDGGNNINNVIIEKGKTIRFPINPTKVGYVFKGWVDSKGNNITKDTIVTDNITIKAVWSKPYTCPDDCIPTEDGSTCTKLLTTSLVSGSGCPSGYKLIENQCLDTSTQVMPNSVESCSDGSTPVDTLCLNQQRDASSAWDCDGKEYFQDGKCIMTSTYNSVCPNNYYYYVEVFGMGATEWCAKKADKISTSVCPSGYTKDGNSCKKTEIIKCTKN